jgi:hypothetical protein
MPEAPPLAGAIGEVLVDTLIRKGLCGSAGDLHNFCSPPLRIAACALREFPGRSFPGKRWGLARQHGA